ncbi:MAG: alpha-E domain-containing protein [Leptospiraceae bacterium]|nr:alpha-E domain-containing protein [Leptospiraceae bacterium]
MYVLSRVADSVYWLNRYVERAESYARLIETYWQLSVENPELTGPLWPALLETTADTSVLQEASERLSQETTIAFLAFDRQNPNSILSCLLAARENARSIREKISKDMWETIHELYTQVLQQAESRKSPSDIPDIAFFRQLRRSCQAFYGISDSTLSHDETYFFALLGRSLERADKTTRILDLQSYMLTGEEQSGDTGLILSFAVLRATSAHEMFSQAYPRVSAENILDFLLLSRTFPRAVTACLLQIEYALRSLALEQKGFFINKAHKKVKQLLLELRHTDVSRLVGDQLNAYLDNLQMRLNEIGDEITRTYFVSSS